MFILVKCKPIISIMKNTCALLFVLFVFSSIGQILPKSVYSSQQWDEEAPAYDVVSINYEYLSEVQQFKKIEFGLDLQGDILNRVNAFIHEIDSINVPLNPFLEWDLRVTAHFQLENSEIVKMRDAFYYQEYSVLENQNDWKADKRNPYPMRIRFAPPNAGKWITEIMIQYKDTTGSARAISLPLFEFTVVENNHPGYVKVHKNKRNLERGGKVIFPVGHNMAGPYNGVETYGGSPKTTHKRALPDDWKSFRTDIMSYAEKGGKYIKLLQLPYSSLLEFEELGNYYNRLHYAWEQDKILDFCEDKDVLIHFNLMFQNPIMKVGQYNRTIFDFGHWDGTDKINERDKYPAYCYYTHSGKQPHEMFLDAKDVSYHKQRVRYYMARYGYSPQIYNIEILSEPWHINSKLNNPNYYTTGFNEGKWEKPFNQREHPDHEIVQKALVNYHNEISTYIKKDLKDRDHLVGITIYSGGSSWPWGPEDFELDKSVFLENIDIIGLNRYESAPDKLIQSKNSKNNEIPLGENSAYHMIKRLHAMCDKPVIFSEAGSDGVCDLSLAHTVDVMTLGFTGIAGFHMWLGYRHGENRFDERTLWRSTINSQNHMNSDAVSSVLGDLNGNWTQGRQMAYIKGNKNKPAKELQYYISEDKKKSIGYVKNRTFNDVSYGQNNCTREYPEPWNKPADMNYKSGKLQIQGLKKGKYKIEWYEQETGKFISCSDVKVRRSGKLKKIPHPVLTVQNKDSARGVLWFVLR